MDGNEIAGQLVKQTRCLDFVGPDPAIRITYVGSSYRSAIVC